MTDGAGVSIPEIAGAILIERPTSQDDRGQFRDFLRCDLSAADPGAWAVRQVSVSVSNRNVVRGIHYSPGSGPGSYWQAVTCVSGRVIDVLIDLRMDSPTFQQRWSVELTAMSEVTVVMPPGVGHGFRSLADSATLIYAMSVPFPEAVTLAVRPDCVPELGWNPSDKATIVSAKDLEAPSLAAAIGLGVLP